MSTPRLQIPAFLFVLGFIVYTLERFSFSGIANRVQNSLTSADVAYILCALIFPVALAISIRRIRNIRLVHVHFFSMALALVVTLGGFFCFVMWDKANPTPTAIVVGATLATLGWLTQQAHQESLQRKQHTLNILVQMRQSEIFSRHRVNLLSQYPYGTTINAADVSRLLDERKHKTNYDLAKDGSQKYPLIDSIYYVANFYEFLASGVKEGDIDKNLLRESLRFVMNGYYEKVKEVLKIDQAPDSNGVPTKEVFNNYYWLVNNWGD